MNKQRRHFTGAEKVAILKRHLVDKVPISDLCDELGLYPNQVYGWLKEFFENGHFAFDNGRKSKAGPERLRTIFVSLPGHFAPRKKQRGLSNMRNLSLAIFR
jgi:transposase-like protein